MDEIPINRKIVTDNLTPRQVAACIGMCGGGERTVEKMLGFLYGKDYSITKTEKKRWRKTIEELKDYSLLIENSYFKISSKSVQTIMNCDKRYRNNLLAFYAYILSKHLFATHVTRISYATISKERNIADGNIAKYIGDLEALKVLKCSRAINKNKNDCNIYAPYEYRHELTQYNKRHNRKSAFDYDNKDLYHYRHLTSVATKLLNNPEKWVNYTNHDLINVYTYAKQRNKRRGKRRDLSVLEQIPPIKEYICNMEECEIISNFFT